MQKNIIHITGDDSYGIELEIRRWIRVFTEKYSELNIERIRLEDRSTFGLIRDNLTMTGLFSEKRLFLFSGGVDRKTKYGGIEEILESIKESIPEDHFCVFHNISSKEGGLIDWLKENADTRNISTLWSAPSWQQRFPDISGDVVTKIIREYKTREEEKNPEERNPQIGHIIASTLEYTLLLGGSYHSGLISTEGGGKIFDLIDLILGNKKRESIQLAKKILETTSPAEFIPSLIGLLRNHLYIKYLQRAGKDANAISKIIKVHPFILKKSLGSSIHYERLKNLFDELVSVNKAYKSGKGLQDSELGRIFGIEIALMGLKK